MAYEALEDLEIFQLAERIGDRLHELIGAWGTFDKETTGRQLLRAADSIGANIAEGYGRYHYGEKLNFLYYARGSLYETKFWLRRVQKRSLLPQETTDNALNAVNTLAVKLNSYITYTRKQRREQPSNPNSLKESTIPYITDSKSNSFGTHNLGFIDLDSDELKFAQWIPDNLPSNDIRYDDLDETQ